MKQTPAEVLLRQQFEVGKITKDGFLGSDSRHIHDIIAADQRVLSEMDVTAEEIADKLQLFIEKGKKELEGIADAGDYTVQIQWSRGLLPCPFKERGLHHKIIATVKAKKSGKQIQYSQLNVHMIRQHHFFEGTGSFFRLEPQVLAHFLELTST